MKKRISLLIPAAILFIIPSFILYGESIDASLGAEDFAVKKELLNYYEQILKQSAHQSRVDFSFGAVAVFTESPYTSMTGSLIFRPFAPKYYLHRDILRSHTLYRESSRLTGFSLSQEAEERMRGIVREIEAYRERPPWRRVVLSVGMIPPLSFPEVGYEKFRYVAGIGYEPVESIIISAGASIEEEPKVVLSATIALFSEFYSAGYSWMERMEQAFTTRHIYRHD